MTAGVVADVPARTLRPTRATWPLWLITAGMPLAYLVGLQGLAWPLVSVVLVARLIVHRGTRIPWSMVPLLIFVCWAPLSFAAAPVSGLPIFTYRWLLFVGCLALGVWIVNIDRRTLSSEQIVDWMAALWIATIAFGYLAQIFSTLDMPSPLSLLLGPIGRVDFVARISDWHLADVDEFSATVFARPAAPWSAANSWGAAVGILTPFFVRSWLVDVDRRRRRKGVLLLVASSVPIVLSANRGLWIGLVLGLVYFTARKALRGRFGALAVLLGAIAVVGTLLVVTPAGSLVQDRISGSGDSDTSRSQLYEDAWQGAQDSPLVGNGVPRTTDYYTNSPPVGTHGLLWYLMFIHGFVGLALFLGWLVIEVFRSGQVRTPLGWWTHLSLVIGLIEVPYYGLLPHVMLLGIAVGLSHRERSESEASLATVTPAAAGAAAAVSDRRGSLGGST